MVCDTVQAPQLQKVKDSKQANSIWLGLIHGRTLDRLVVRLELTSRAVCCSADLCRQMYALRPTLTIRCTHSWTQAFLQQSSCDISNPLQLISRRNAAEPCLITYAGTVMITRLQADAATFSWMPMFSANNLGSTGTSHSGVAVRGLVMQMIEMWRQVHCNRPQSWPADTRRQCSEIARLSAFLPRGGM